MRVLDSTFHLWLLHKVTLCQRHRTLPPRTTFSQRFRKRRTKTFVRCWKAKALSQHSFRRSIRLAGSRWKEGACSTSLKVFLVGLGFAKRVTRSTGPSFSHGRGSTAADIPKASINSWPIPLGTSCASRPDDTSHICTPKTLLCLVVTVSLSKSWWDLPQVYIEPCTRRHLSFYTSVTCQNNFVVICCARTLAQPFTIWKILLLY